MKEKKINQRFSSSSSRKKEVKIEKK